MKECMFFYRLVKSGQENLLRMGTYIKWRHRIQNSGPMAVSGRARCLSVTDDTHNTESSRVGGEETFCFFET